MDVATRAKMLTELSTISVGLFIGTMADLFKLQEMYSAPRASPLIESDEWLADLYRRNANSIPMQPITTLDSIISVKGCGLKVNR